jgi:hypothetical protein
MIAKPPNACQQIRAFVGTPNHSWLRNALNPVWPLSWCLSVHNKTFVAVSWPGPRHKNFCHFAAWGRCNKASKARCKDQSVRTQVMRVALIARPLESKIRMVNLNKKNKLLKFECMRFFSFPGCLLYCQNFFSNFRQFPQEDKHKNVACSYVVSKTS